MDTIYNIEHDILMRVAGFKHVNGRSPQFLVLSNDMLHKLLSDESISGVGSRDINGTLKYMGMLVSRLESHNSTNQILIG